MLQVHRPGRRDYKVQPEAADLVLGENTAILIKKDADRVIRQAARDLQDYFAVSLGLDLCVKQRADFSSPGQANIILATHQDLPGLELLEGEGPRGFLLDCQENITICGYDSAGAFQGSIYLEDRLNLRRAPYLVRGETRQKPLFSPRMIHSGYGLDDYPDAHLAAIAHAGLDAILVFVKDVDTTPYGYLDFNQLCWRAAGFGLDVYVYSYLVSKLHPADPGADAYYDKVYGSIFKACPAFKGIVMVGESVEFPSRDPNTTGMSYKTPSPDGLPKTKPSPGWWPCSDYPEWLSLVRDSVRRYKKDADIVFWTYNWGYVAEEHRLALLDKLPTDISLLVTFEMFEKVKTGSVTSTCVDYTLMFPGPGQYFLSEAKKAKARNIRLYSMVNTGGLTWDIGVIPYEPVPGQWLRRHKAILECREKYGLCGLMESHHFGFWPSFISELAKASFTGQDPDQALVELARRDFTGQWADQALAAWQLYTEGIQHYLSTNEDQYGPFRIGPAYPLVLNADVSLPESPQAMFGRRIVNTRYQASDNGRCSLFSFRLPVEIEYSKTMRDRFAQGAASLADLADKLPHDLKDIARGQARLGQFISNCAQTTVNVKYWYLAKQELMNATSADQVRKAVARLKQIGQAEIANAQATIPLVEADSRLGWEPSMEYMCDKAHLEWKIRQVGRVLESELPVYLEALQYDEE